MIHSVLSKAEDPRAMSRAGGRPSIKMKLREIRSQMTYTSRQIVDRSTKWNTVAVAAILSTALQGIVTEATSG